MTVWAFVSYPREADATGNISQFATLFQTEVQLLGLRDFKVLIDRTDLTWGQKWKNWISERPKNASFLIPFASPAYFQSAPCRTEFDAFSKREKELGLSGHILPIMYVKFGIEDEASARVKKWKRQLLTGNYADFSALRHEMPDGPSFRHALANMASALVDHHKAFASVAQVRKSPTAKPPPIMSGFAEPAAHERQSEQVKFRIISNKDRSTLHIEPDLTFELIYTPIIEQDFEKYRLVRERFEEHVAKEVMSHQAMLKYDYESRAIPLPEGITVFVTKQGKLITLEWLTKSPLSPDTYAAWQTLCRGYYVVTRLPFRGDNQLLLSARIRNQALNCLGDLVKDAQSFFFEVVKVKESPLIASLDDRSRQAEAALMNLELVSSKFGDDISSVDQCVGEFALDAEIAISNIHKMIVEYGRLQNQ